MIRDASLLYHLTSVLPAGVTLRVYHISTPTTLAPALFSAPPSQPEEETFCESHFLAIALPGDENGRGEVLAFAIEVLIFTTKSLTTIFVSKADSTGFLHLLRRPKGSESVVRTISTSFLQYLVQKRLPGPRLVLSLFARSQNQYLFPGSIENAEKHVLDDRQLIKWWCRCLDPIIRNGQLSGGPSNAASNPVAYIIVPGCDKGETRAFFPLSARGDPPSNPKWVGSYPLHLLASDVSAPPRCLIPRLPDDPKARFLDDLDREHFGDQGQWRSVKSIDEFWEMMSYRQECSAGSLVGFIWVIFVESESSSNSKTPAKPVQKVTQVDHEDPSLPTPGQSQVGVRSTPSFLAAEEIDLEQIPLPRSPPPSSPTPPPQSQKNEKSEGEVSFCAEVKKSTVRWPEAGRGDLIVKATEYETLMDHLLQLDFAMEATAVQSTKSWVEKAASLAERDAWGQLLVGQNTISSTTPSTLDTQLPMVNILTGVRKKRKVDLVEMSPQKTSKTDLEANVLATGLVRKKPKT